MDTILYEDIEHKPDPTKNWEHFELWQKVRECLYSLPLKFECGMRIPQLAVQDIYSLNTSLAFSIENHVVETMNQLRPIWDVYNQYAAYNFTRQAQVFPDTLLKREPPKEDIIMGIELKGWYVFAKEGEPSFRYETTPQACTGQDLLVIVPWCLDGVLSGKPILFQPFITSARAAAVYRNHYWANMRNTSNSRKIIRPTEVTPYPKGREHICDHADYDTGKNFGRLARTGMMDTFVNTIKRRQISGIEIESWRKFFRDEVKE